MGTFCHKYWFDRAEVSAKQSRPSTKSAVFYVLASATHTLMRTLTLLAATVLVAAKGGAQTPLTIDPTFEYFITPEWIEQWGSGFYVADIALRPEGEIITSGNQLHPPGGATGGSPGGTLLVDGTGAFVDSPFQGQGAAGRISVLDDGSYFYGYKRYDSTGERDFSFGFPDLPYVGLSDWYVYPDRSVLVGGAFKLEEDGLIEYGLIKVDEWGAYDPTYTARKVGPGTSGTVGRIFPLNNGQFVLSGSFSTYEGEFSGPVVRINPDGSRDPSFYFPAWKGEVAALYEQPDGKLLLGGRLFMNDIADTLKLVRVLPDGSLDPTFNNLVDYRTGNMALSAMGSGVSVITPLNDGRLVVGGKFTQVDWQPRGCIACTDTLGNLLDCWADGGLVPEAYSPSGYPYVALSGFKCLSSGDCYLFGEYKGFIDANGLHPRRCLMSRIHMPGVGVQESETLADRVQIWPNPGTDVLNIRNNTEQALSFQLSDMSGRILSQGGNKFGPVMIDTSDIRPGYYLLSVVDEQGRRSTFKWLRS